MIYKNSQNFNQEDEPYVLLLLKQLDNYFSPPLNKRVNLSIYASKLISKGTIDLAFSIKNDEATGMIGYYCNDIKSEVAYISVLGVVPKYQGKGIAKTLLEMCLKNCKNKNMKSVKVKTEIDNHKAINLYRKHGFEITPSMELDDKNKIVLIKNLM